MSEPSEQPNTFKLKLSNPEAGVQPAPSIPPTPGPIVPREPLKIVARESTSANCNSTPPTQPVAVEPNQNQANPQTIAQISSPSPKSHLLGSILFMIGICGILTAAITGIWYLLKNNTTEPSAENTPAMNAATVNPIANAQVAVKQTPQQAIEEIMEALDPAASTMADTPAPENEGPAVSETTLTAEASGSSLREQVSQYLQTIQIEGIRSGPQARVMLHGKNFKINEIIQPDTGLIFIGLSDQELRFKDRNGVIYVKIF
ncbi:MAG: hypothetical protein P8M62_05605 [Opitutae bacterium]|nr:hypothetical protein [Opitutae bacterium]